MKAQRGGMEGERRAAPSEREVILSAEDRDLARLIVNEVKKHLGIKDIIEWREEQTLLREILPMLQTMHNAYKWRADLYRWWLTMFGKGVLTVLTFTVVAALAYGLSPAFRVVVYSFLEHGPR